MARKDPVKRVKLLCISDVHLGQSICQAELVEQVLDYFGYDILVLLGDTFDDANLKRLKDRHWSVLHRVNRKSKHGVQVELIRGNHDEDVLEFLAVMTGGETHDAFIWDHCGKRFHFAHGDKEDDFLFRNPIQTAVGSGIYWFLQRVLGARLAEPICKWLKGKAKGYARATEHVAHRSLELAEESASDYAIRGHTHHAEHVAGRGRHYYNTGCWTELPCTCLTVDDEGVIRLHFFNGSDKHELTEISAITPPQ